MFKKAQIREPAIQWIEALPKGTRFLHSQLCHYFETNFPREGATRGKKAPKEAWFAMWDARLKLGLIKHTGRKGQRQRC